METVNQRNNQPQLFPGGEETLAGLVAICREKMWPLLKNSTRISYDFHLDTYILPKWGSMKLAKLRTIELQDFFNSFSPRLASKTIRNMHGCLRAVLNQGKAWELVHANPAQGVRLPRKKARKPPVVLAKQDIRRTIEALPEPTKSIVTLMLVGSLRIGEVAALRWERIHPDRIEIVERFYEGEFDDTKTDAGRRSIPLDSFGILRGVLDAVWQRSKHRNSGESGSHECKRGPGEPAESTEPAAQADDQEAWVARFNRFPELSHHAFQPDEQYRGPA
jgi:hypothetical protein